MERDSTQSAFERRVLQHFWGPIWIPWVDVYEIDTVWETPLDLAHCTSLDVLSQIGSLVREESDENRYIISCLVQTGRFGLNPAVLSLIFKSTGNDQWQLRIRGATKRGLIKTGGARNAVELFIQDYEKLHRLKGIN